MVFGLRTLEFYQPEPHILKLLCKHGLNFTTSQIIFTTNDQPSQADETNWPSCIDPEPPRA